MRLISLVLALVAIAALILFNREALFSSKPQDDQTVKQQTEQILQEAQKSAEELRSALEEQKRHMEELNK